MSAIGIDDVEGLLGVGLYEEEGEFPVEQGYIWTTCSSVENGNPLFWDEAVAEEITGGPIAPPTMVSVWFRPHHWAPNRSTPGLPLQIHFDLKEGLGLPEAVMSDNTIVFHEPVRPGDVLRTRQILRSVSDEKTTKLGTGRFWVIDVEYHNQRGDLVAVESYTGFGYRRSGGGRTVMTTPTLAPGRGRGGRRPARAGLPGDGHDRGPRRPRRPRLAADAPRQGLRRQPQRHPGHLPQHAEPGLVVRALHHRLDRALRPPAAGDVPHAGLDLPGRHDGVPRHRDRHRGGRHRVRLGRPRHHGVRRRGRQDLLHRPGRPAA